MGICLERMDNITVLQWYLSIVDTIGTGQSVLIKEVSTSQRYTFATIGTPESLLIIEVS